MSTNCQLLKYPLAFLRYQGMWPRKNQSSKSYLLQSLCVSMMFSPTLLAPLIHTIYIFSVNAKPFLPEIFENISLVSSCTAFYCIAFRFISKQKDIAKIVYHLGDFSIFGRPDDSEEVERTCSIYGILLSGYVLFGVVIYTCLSVFIEKEGCEIKNEKYGTQTICGMFTPLWLPFDVQGRFLKTSILIVQIVSAWTMVGYPSLMNFVNVAIVLHVISRIRHLNQKIGKVFEVDDTKIQEERLRECIEYHIDIIKILDDLNEVSMYMMLVFVTLVSIIFSLIGYKLLLEFSLGSFAHIIGWILTTLAVCACGQVLTNASSLISLAIYDARWYNAEVKLQKTVLIILMRSQKPMSLKTLTFGVINFATFQAIINSAYSYLALLRRTVRHIE